MFGIIFDTKAKIVMELLNIVRDQWRENTMLYLDYRKFSQEVNLPHIEIIQYKLPVFQFDVSLMRNQNITAAHR